METVVKSLVTGKKINVFFNNTYTPETCEKEMERKIKLNGLFLRNVKYGFS